MKLSDYARRLRVSYKTAWCWRRAGKLDAYQVTTGTIIVRAHHDPGAGHGAGATHRP